MPIMYRRVALVSAGVLVALIAFLAYSVSARADGKFYQYHTIQQTPNIPLQRAVLTYRDGVERLVIESSFRGDGKQFAWLVPVPAAPTKLEVVSPGWLKTLDTAIQPGFVNAVSELPLWKMLAGGLTFALVLFMLAWSRSREERVAFTVLGFVIGSLLALFFLLGPRYLGPPPPTGIESVYVEQVVSVDEYDVAVLSSGDAEGLSLWLSENGFAPLDASEHLVVADYLQSGWRFVAAKLARPLPGLTAPRPLAISFATDKPVYPMRLTGTVGSEVHLDLFVIADQQAVSDRLKTVCSDAYRWNTRAGIANFEQYFGGFVGAHFSITIGHPAAKAELWDGCVVTRLGADLGPEQMTEDIGLTLRPFKPIREHRLTKDGAEQLGLTTAVVVWSVGLPLLVFVFRRRLSGARRVRFLFESLILPLTVVTLLLAMILPYCYSQGLRDPQKITEPRHYVGQISAAIFGEEPVPSGTASDLEPIVVEIIRQRFKKNPMAGGRVRVEDSPGNIAVIEDERGIVLRAYGPSGFGHDVVLRGAEIESERVVHRIRWVRPAGAGLLYLLLPFAYLLGAIPFGLLLGFVAGKDVRREGSGNVGATNVLRTCGAVYGIPALLLDVFKGFGPTVFAVHVLDMPLTVTVLVALAAVLGHNYPIWLTFKAGKGVATSAGALLALAPIAVAVGAVVFLLVVATTRYVSLGSMTGTAAMVVAYLALAEAPFGSRGLPTTVLVVLLLVFVLVGHRANIQRLFSGQESRLASFRKPALPTRNG